MKHKRKRKRGGVRYLYFSSKKGEGGKRREDGRRKSRPTSGDKGKGASNTTKTFKKECIKTLIHPSALYKPLLYRSEWVALFLCLIFRWIGSFRLSPFFLHLPTPRTTEVQLLSIRKLSLSPPSDKDPSHPSSLLPSFPPSA